MTEAVVDVLWSRGDAEDEALVERVCGLGGALLEAAGVAERELSVVLTDDAGIRVENARWRGEDKATDVLSFPMDEGEEAPDPDMPLGDIMVSLDTAGAQAEAHGQSLWEELTFLMIHGLCHLLGHDHGEPEEAARMRSLEDRLLAAVAPGQKRPPTPY